MYGVYGGLDNMDIDNRLYMVKYDFEDNKEKVITIDTWMNFDH